MSQEKSKINPLYAAAAVAIILFSGVGIAVMTGVIPTSRSELATQTPDSRSGATSTTAPSAASQSAPARTPPARVAANEPAPRAAPHACADCGVIDSVQVVTRKGESTWMGPVGGAVVGGLIGNQIGSGRGNTAATVVGAAGGAVAGNEVEKRIHQKKQYEVAVRMNSGHTRHFEFESDPGYQVGEKVRVVDGRIVRS